MWCLYMLPPKKWYVHGNWPSDNAPIALGQDGNSGAHGQPKLVHLLEFPQQHEGF